MPTDTNSILAASYKSTGFVCLRSLLSHESLHQATAWIDRIFNQPIPDTMEPSFEKDGASLKKLRWLFWHDREFWEPWIAQSNIIQIIREIGNFSPVLIRHAAFLKRKQIGSEVGWHQDQALWGVDYRDALTLWIALDRCTAENGCVKIISGSFNLGPLLHAKGAINDQRFEKEEKELSLVAPELNPGDALLWHRYAIHGSEPNRSAQNRKGMVMVFANNALSDFKETRAFRFN